MKLYDLASPHSVLPHKLARTHRAVLTGEKRLPKKGEWFISGKQMAWQAENDLDTAEWIAVLVKVKEYRCLEIIGIDGEVTEKMGKVLQLVVSLREKMQKQQELLNELIVSLIQKEKKDA